MRAASPLPVIKNRKDFLRVAASGRKWIAPALVLQMCKRPDDNHTALTVRIGYTASKKVGGAVQRNRAKRRLREAVRIIAPSHVKPGHDYVVIARKSVVACEFSALLRDMEFAFSRIHANKKASPKPDRS